MAKRILVVDDELDMRVFMSTLLETNGYKAVTAEDGLQGLEVARKTKPSVIVMDVMMPKESGIRFYREIKKDPELRKVPVIMVSAMSKKTFFHSQNVLDEYEGGSKLPDPTFYIEKPPDADELLTAVQNALVEVSSKKTP
jgi:two-component system, OmpR family, phosphate regulon response regulator PhoB